MAVFVCPHRSAEPYPEVHSLGSSLGSYAGVRFRQSCVTDGFAFDCARSVRRAGCIDCVGTHDRQNRLVATIIPTRITRSRQQCRSHRRAAASSLLLNRRTLDRAVGAEHATVPWPGSQQCLALTALVEVQAGIRGHRLHCNEPAVRAGQHGLEDDGVHDDTDFPVSIRFSSPLSIRRSRSLAPPIRTPLTNTIGKVGHPVHIFKALRRRHPLT